MGHLKARHLGEAHHPAGQHAQPGVFAHFFGGVKQGLHAHADPQHRVAAADGGPQRLDQPALAQALHEAAKGPYARENDTGRVPADRGVGGDADGKAKAW